MKVIGIWKLPLAKDEAHSTWRIEWLGEIKKSSDLDHSFKDLIEKDRVLTCEKYFAGSVSRDVRAQHQRTAIVWCL